MDVLLIEADDLPDGCLLSLRAGAECRHATVDGQRAALQVPCGLAAAGPAQLELLAPVGSAALELSPSEEPRPVWLESAGGSRVVKMTLQVRKDESPAAAGPDSLAPLQSQSYLHEHGLVPWVQELLQGLERERPADPWSYIGARSAARSQEIRSSAASQELPPTTSSTSGARGQSLSEGAAPCDDSEPRRLLAAPHGMAIAQAQLRNTLGSAAADGRLAQLLLARAEDIPEGHSSPAHSSPAATSSTSSASEEAAAVAGPAGLEGLRGCVRDVLSDAASDGRLLEVLETSERLREDDGAACSQTPKGVGMMRLPPPSTWALAYAAPSKQQAAGCQEDLCSRLRSVLADAAADGKLETALAESDARCQEHEVAGMMRLPPQSTWELAYSVPPSRENCSGKQAPGMMRPPPASTWALAYSNPGKLHSRANQRDLRSHLRSVFASATRDGRLERILEEGPEAELSEAEEQEEAVIDRRQAEQEELERPAGDEQLRAAKARLRSLLSGAASSGRLVQALPQEPSPACGAADGLQSRAFDLLSRGAADGRLREAVAEARTREDPQPTSSDSGSVQNRAVSLLSSAFADGRLQEAVKESQLSGSAVGSLKAKAFSLLSVAVADGRLHNILAEERREQDPQPIFSDPDGVQARASSLLSNAASNGRLQEALVEMRRAQDPQPISSDPDGLQARASRLLSDAASSGRLQEILVEMCGEQESQPACSDVDSLRAKAFSLLSGVAVDGRLHATLAEEPRLAHSGTEESLRASVASFLSSAAEDGRLRAAMAKLRQQQERQPTRSDANGSLRANVSSLLSSAARDGSLQAVMAEMRRQQEPQPTSGDADSLRARALGLLSGAAADGRLRGALAEARGPEEPQPICGGDDGTLQARALGLLSGAAVDGRLQEALAEARREEEPQPARSDDGLQARAFDLLSCAAADGRLGDALAEARAQDAQPPCSDVESLKARAFGLLTSAAADGRLRSTLTAKRGRQEPDGLHARAFGLLSGAAADGRLREALAETQDQQDPESAGSDADGLRARAFGMLSGAARDGRLRSVLAEKGEQQEMRSAAGGAPSLQASLSGLLSKAATSGRLMDAFAEVRRRQEEKDARPSCDSLKASVSGLIARAAVDGRLSRALAGVRQQQRQEEEQPTCGDFDAVKSRVSGLLSEAAADGSLMSALAAAHSEATTPAASPSGGIEALRTRAFGLLQGAAADGRLRQVLAAKGRQEPPARAESPLAAGDSDDLLAQLRGIMSSAAQDGRLSCALAQDPQEASLDGICAQVRGMMVTAALNGRLAVAMAEEHPAVAPIVGAPEDALAEEAAAGGGPSQSAPAARRPMHMLPSVGTWLAAPSRPRAREVAQPPTASTASSPEPVLSQGAPATEVPGSRREPVSWNLLPSAGTWLLPAARPREQTLQQAAAEETAPAVEARGSAPQPVPWHLRPSAGTWLAPAPLRRAPAPPRAAAEAPASCDGVPEDGEVADGEEKAAMMRQLELPLADGSPGEPALASPANSECSSVQLLRELLGSAGSTSATPSGEVEEELLNEFLAAPCAGAKVAASASLEAPARAASKHEVAAEAAPPPTASDSVQRAASAPIGEASPKRAEQPHGSPGTAPEPGTARPNGAMIHRRHALVQSPGAGQKTPIWRQRSIWKDPVVRSGLAERAEKSSPAREGLPAGASGSWKGGSAQDPVARSALAERVERSPVLREELPVRASGSWKGSSSQESRAPSQGSGAERMAAIRDSGIIGARPNTAQLQKAAAREILKDIAGLGETAGRTTASEECAAAASVAERLQRSGDGCRGTVALAMEAFAELGAGKSTISQGPAGRALRQRPAPPPVPSPEAARPEPPRGCPTSPTMGGASSPAIGGSRLPAKPASLPSLHRASPGLTDSLPELRPRPGVERFPRENERLWLASEDFKKRRQQVDTSVSCSENEKLRTNLGKLLSFRRNPFAAR